MEEFYHSGLEAAQVKPRLTQHWAALGARAGVTHRRFKSRQFEEGLTDYHV